MLNQLIGNFYINENLISKISNHNTEFVNGLIFVFDDNIKGSLLDFFQKNFIYYEDFNQISANLLTHNYFFNKSDKLNIEVRDNKNIFLKIEQTTGFDLVFGKNRNLLLSLSWIFINQKNITLNIKKEEQKDIALQLTDISPLFIESIVKEIISSYPDEKNKIPFSILDGSTIIEKIESLIIKTKDLTNFNPINDQIIENLVQFLKTKDLVFLLKNIGNNHSNFWKDDFINQIDTL